MEIVALIECSWTGASTPSSAEANGHEGALGPSSTRLMRQPEKTVYAMREYDWATQDE